VSDLTPYLRESFNGLKAMLDWQHRRVLHDRATTERPPQMGGLLRLLRYEQEKLPPCDCWGCVLWRTDAAAAEEATSWIYALWREEARVREDSRLRSAWVTMSPEERRHGWWRAMQTESDAGWPMPDSDDDDCC
jgi:hypothetical protein